MYQEVFNRLMKIMRPFMKEQGFTCKGNNFYKRHPQGNIGIISFHRNWRGLPKFSIDIGIYSLLLAEFFLEKLRQQNIKKIPSIADCHWQTCMGSLVPKQHPSRQKDKYWQKYSDKWWEYDDTIDINQLFNEISSLILDYGIPVITQHFSDKQLIEKWLVSVESTKKHAEKEVGELRAATERARVQILRDLSVLFLSYGEKEKFKIMMTEFDEYLQRYPEYTGLKEDYDKLIKEPHFSIEALAPEKKSASEVNSNPDHKIKK